MPPRRSSPRRLRARGAARGALLAGLARASLAAAAVLSIAGAARASLTPSEGEQVRRDVVTATHVDQVRALVARPDLSPDEAAAAIARPLALTPVDREHAAFLHDLVFSDESTPSRPVLAVAAVRALLARADQVIGEHQTDLERQPAALDELRRVYALVEEVASAGDSANVRASSRSECARALAEHFARNPTTLGPQSPVGPRLAQARAQAAIAALDFAPEGPTRRLDAASALGLTGARRAMLVDRGVLLLDAGGDDARAAGAKAMLDRLFPGSVPLEAILVGGDPSRLAARDGAVASVAEPSAGEPPRWAPDVDAPPVDAWTVAAARGIAVAALASATSQRPDLAARVDGDGGRDAVAAAMARLAVDAPRAVRAAASRFADGHPEDTAALSDAIGALRALAPAGAARGGRSVQAGVQVGPDGGAGAAELTRIALDPAGAAASFRLGKHAWAVARDASGAVIAVRRDGARLPSPSAVRR